MKHSDAPEIIRQAASRIAGTALGPFIMGQRNVDLEALEQRINERVIEEMQFVLAGVVAVLAKTSVVVVMDETKRQSKAAPKKPKAQKSRGADNPKAEKGKK